MRNPFKKKFRLQVKKRDGRIENFDRNKLKNSFFAAGHENEKDVENLALEIIAWIQETVKGEHVESQALRDKVVEMLGNTDPEAAERYKTFRREAIISIK
ncbi:hypothetical protein KJ596_01970 [Patescibacteria group bacterium]|nr:hypothetical protein [Patescibacteria group bacterium]MBU1867998.1 hypothetical protein [Patescibacteria group bacterium]